MAIIINPYTIPQFFAGILSLALGLYAFYKNPKERTTQIFFLMMLGCSLWSLTPLAVQAAPTSENALLWAKLSNIGLLILPVALFHFTFIYHRKKMIEFFKIAIIYIITIIMIILLLGTNLFFSMADDGLIDGDGAQTAGRGTGNYSEEYYFSLTDDELASFYYIDVDGDEYYSVENSTLEPLKYNDTIIVGQDLNGTWVQLNESLNHYLIYYVDENHNGSYTLGESLYLENGDGNQKLVYYYIQGPLYYLLILFFFGFIIAAIVNLFLFYRKSEDKTIKRPVSFLILGLIAIIIFILSQRYLAFLIPLTILDSFIALIISIFFTIAVLKYNIVDIKLIIRKSMFYSLASLIVVICFVLVEEGMEIVFAEFAFSGSIFTGIIAAFIALLLFSSIKKGLRHQIDKLFPSVRYLDKEYQSRIKAYKSTIYAMLADGIISDKEASAIDILRDKLEIKPQEHEDIMRSIKREMGRKAKAF